MIGLQEASKSGWSPGYLTSKPPKKLNPKFKTHGCSS
jgi:hypothetical protein